MIAKSYILSNLKTLDSRYRKATTPKDAKFVSKLAILELCGWIEESMDDIVMRCAIRHLKEQKNRKYCRDEIVKRTYGFDYESNFRSMLIRLLGLIAVEKIEQQVNVGLRDAMTAALGTLKTQRNTEAHTHLKGSTRLINAPSVTITQFQPVYAGLDDFDRTIRAGHW